MQLPTTDSGPDPDPRDFPSLFRQFHNGVWRVLQRLGVPEPAIDDALQDVFIVVHRRWPDFQGRSSLRSWVYGIARKTAANYRRRALREWAHRKDSNTEGTDARTPEEWMGRVQAGELLDQFIERLDPGMRRVFALSEFEQMRASEIAVELGLNGNTIRSRLRAIRSQLDRMVHRVRACDRSVEDRSAQFLRARQGANWSLLLVRIDVLAPTCAGGLGGAAAGKATSSATVTGQLTGQLAHASTVAAPKAAGSMASWALAGVVTVTGTTGLLAVAPPSSAIAQSQPESIEVRASTGRVARQKPAARALAAIAEVAAPVELEPAPAQAPAKTVQARRRARAHRPAQPVRVTGDTGSLEQEIQAVHAARSALLRHDFPGVRRTTSDYAARYPDGTFAQEIEAIALEGECAAFGPQRSSGVTQRLERFRVRWPGSGMWNRLRRQCSE